MNASTFTEALEHTDQVKDHRGHPSPGVLVEEAGTCELGSVRPEVPDQAGFQTFIHGAGI